MFTDLEGSTDIATSRGDAAARAIQSAQRDLVTAQVLQRGGRVIETAGDGITALFDSTRKALSCAVEIQRAVAQHNHDHPQEGFRIRIGLNTGEAIESEDKVFGSAVDAAERIAAKGTGGDILVSEVVKQLAGTLPAISFNDRGRLRLKGFAERWRLYEVAWEPSDARPDEGASEPPNGEVTAASGGIFVGRDQELAALLRLLDDAASGRGRFALIVGDPGIGKTRLTEQVAAVAHERGLLVARGRCWEGGGAPAYWPWIQVLRSLFDDLGPDGFRQALGTGPLYITRLVPELGNLLAETAPVLRRQEQDRFALFDSVAKLLTNVARHKPLVVILDDIHAGDEASLLLLRFLARGLGTTRTLVLATYIEAEARRDLMLRPIFGGLAREGERIELAGLSREAVAKVCAARTEQPLPEPVIAEIHKATEGNPFLIDEAVRLASSSGDLRRPDHSLGFRVPEGARDVLRRRLASFSNDVVEALSIASVIGREFDLATLNEVCDVEPDRLLRMLGEAVAAGVVKEISALGRYSFAHVLMRETLYEELAPSDRMRVHREIAETLELRYADDVDGHVDELAHHFFKAAQASDPQKTLDYTLRAAKKAMAATAWEEAIRLYRRAQRVVELAPMSSAKRAEIAKGLDEAEQRAEQGQASDPTALASPAGTTVFARQGDYWAIAYEGKEIRLKDGKGRRYLAQLLKNPGREVHVLDLVAMVEDRGAGDTAARTSLANADVSFESSGRADAGEVVDARARAAYRQRLEELRDDLQEAEEFNDPERAARIRAEMDALVDQLAAGTGLGGRERKASSEVERARFSVTKAVKKTIDKIQMHHPSLGEHLATTVKTGTYCSYMPDPRVPISWES